MLTKKERIELRSLASQIKPVVWVGKDGFNEQVINQIDEELFNHELIKITLQESVPTLSEFELGELGTKLSAEVVTAIGRKIVLFRHSEKKGIKHVLNK